MRLPPQADSFSHSLGICLYSARHARREREDGTRDAAGCRSSFLGRARDESRWRHTAVLVVFPALLARRGLEERGWIEDVCTSYVCVYDVHV